MSETEALRALMEADRWVDRVQSQKSHLPEIAELATVEETLRGLVSALKEAQAAQAPVRTAYEDAAKEVVRLRQRAEELTRALASSSANPRELEALSKEERHVRELLSNAEDREISLLVEVEPLDDVVVSIKAKAQPALERRTALQEAIASLQATLEEEVVALRAQRGERASALSPELLRRYDNALVRAGTSGAAQVDAGRCDGCRIALSPLDHDRWKSQPEGTFMDCPECGRLLLK